MEFRSNSPGTNGGNGNTQSQTPRFQSHTPTPFNGPSHEGPMYHGKKKVLITGGIILLALIVLAFAGLMSWRYFNGAERFVKGDQYQAVFLTNGQVYFCKLSQVDSPYVKCDDIYYLQVQQSVQPTDKSQQNQNPQVSLAKLGSELHGPEDNMLINRSQVLFFENLQDSGKVVQAIKSNHK
ncbi:MAG TPA: hypothetical protein VLG40_00480 [Candidatus Saccharimonas sp.]|nr:hypothetical protein [Candidatus Saccharimonas sp.]